MKAKGTLAKFLARMNEKSLARTRNRMLIAEAIYDALRVLGLSQKQLAERVGKSESEISAILSGGRNFTIDSLTDIAEELHLHLFSNVGQGKSYMIDNTVKVVMPSSRSVKILYAADYEAFSTMIPQPTTSQNVLFS